LQHHCNKTADGILKVNDSKVVGSLVWSSMQRIPRPVEADYGTTLTEKVEIRLACKYKRGTDWRFAFWHIDRPSMARLDKFIHDFFTFTIYVRYNALKEGKAESIRYFMDFYKLTDDDISYDTLYMILRRQEMECTPEIGEIRMPKMPSLA